MVWKADWIIVNSIVVLKTRITPNTKHVRTKVPYADACYFFSST